MTKTNFTTITPIPSGVSRQTVLNTLHSHITMIDLNPAHQERHPINPPPEASAEEYHCKWYEITDKVSYLPGGLYSGRVTFKTCFHDLANGVQIHVYAPAGLDIKQKWTVGGNMPGEPVQPVEIGFGAPVTGLYLREDVEMKCNFLMVSFVRKTFKDALETLVARLSVRTQLQEADMQNHRLTYDPMAGGQFQAPLSPPMRSPGSVSFHGAYPPQGSPQMSYGKPMPLIQGQQQQQQQQHFQPHAQYAQYNPAMYGSVEVDAVNQQSPATPKKSLGYESAPVELE